jgi:alpha-L-arabinofuranosidase
VFSTRFAGRGNVFSHIRRMIFSLVIVPLLASAQTPARRGHIDVSKNSSPISKNIQGQFLEHGGDIVNAGVWSEMLVDRKFFYSVAAAAPTPPPMRGNAAGNPRLLRVPTLSS